MNPWNLNGQHIWPSTSFKLLFSRGHLLRWASSCRSTCNSASRKGKSRFPQWYVTNVEKFQWDKLPTKHGAKVRGHWLVNLEEDHGKNTWNANHLLHLRVTSQIVKLCTCGLCSYCHAYHPDLKSFCNPYPLWIKRAQQNLCHGSIDGGHGGRHLWPWLLI